MISDSCKEPSNTGTQIPLPLESFVAFRSFANATATGMMKDNAFSGNGRILPPFTNDPKEKQTLS